jgi:hypothetical protein
MKRYLPLLAVILFPYFIPVLAVLGFCINPLGEIVFAGEGALILGSWFFMYIIALICSLLVLIISLFKKRDSQEMLRTIMTVKLLHLPAQLVIFFIALICLGLMLDVVAVILVYFDFAICILSGLVGVGGLIRGFCEKRLSLQMVIFHGILQFIFFADIASSIFVYRKVKLAAEKQGSDTTGLLVE